MGSFRPRPSAGVGPSWIGVVTLCLCVSRPCFGAEHDGAREGPVDETPAEDGELRLGVEFLAGSVGYVHPLEPGLKMGGALGFGLAVRKAWGINPDWEVTEVIELLRAEWFVSHEAAQYVWVDAGISVALSIVNGPETTSNPDAFAVAASALAFVEPLFGWQYFRVGSRLGGGGLQDLDSRRWNVVGAWGLLTVKIIIPT